MDCASGLRGLRGVAAVIAPRPDCLELFRWERSRPLAPGSIDLAGLNFTPKPKRLPAVWLFKRAAK